MKQLLPLIIFSFLFSKAFAQSESENCSYNFLSDAPKELTRDRLMEGDNYGNPYTMFVKESGFNLDVAIQSIQKQIIEGHPISIYSSGAGKIYLDLYDYAIQNNIKPCESEVKDCAHANWVKANAIIYLIKLLPVKRRLCLRLIIRTPVSFTKPDKYPFLNWPQRPSLCCVTQNV